MKEHLLCYIRRDRLASWKLDSLERERRNRPVLAYGSNAPTFAEYAKPGNVLWVVSGSPDAPPSLEARIEISSQIATEKEWKCEVEGSTEGSQFFGLNDASEAVMALVFKSESSLWSLRNKYSSARWNSSYGRELQSPRRLAPPGERVNRHRSTGAEPLERLALRATNRSVFISWKHADNNRKRRRFIKALTCHLAELGFSVWWDQTALSDIHVIYEYEYYKNEPDPTMNKLLRQGLSQTTAVLALWTENYGTASSAGGPNWTSGEWHFHLSRIALVSGEFVSKPSMIDPDRVLVIPENPDSADAERIALQFKRRYDSIKRN